MKNLIIIEESLYRHSIITTVILSTSNFSTKALTLKIRMNKKLKKKDKSNFYNKKIKRVSLDIKMNGKI